ncbi:MAG: DUF4199 domain-containing protein [Bacteroidales bacterium]|nr:DUF4199 domain-containing protein [Bacteroidales bacterium]
MEKKTTLFNHSLTWGVILGIVLIVYTLILYFLNLSTNRALGYVSWLITIVIVFYAMKMYRDNVNQGALSFGNAFVIGLLVCIISGLISSIFAYIQFTVISPELIDKMVQIGEERLLSRGMPDDMVEQSMEMSRKFMTPTMISVMAFIMTIIFGAILSLILAAFVKREPNPFQAEQ